MNADQIQVTEQEARALAARGVQVLYSIRRDDLSRIIASSKPVEQVEKVTTYRGKLRDVIVHPKAERPKRKGAPQALYDFLQSHFPNWRGTRSELIATAAPYLSAEYDRRQIAQGVHYLVEKNQLVYTSGGKA